VSGESTRPVTVDDLLVTLDRVWARSPSRRTQFSFSLGPSRVEHLDGSVYRVGGGAAVIHPFARSWNLRATYRRGMTFVQGDNRPFPSNSVNFGIAGLATSRLDVSLDLGTVLGDVGLEGESEPFDSYVGVARMRYGFNRTVALYAEYVYNSSRYASTSTFPDIDRSGVRGGMTIFWPLLQTSRTRRPQ
jgi:hypothetical protein